MIKTFIIAVFILINLTCYSQVSKDALLGKEDVVNKQDEWVQYKEMYIQKSTLKAFKKMRRAARWSFIKIDIVSAYRSFDRQKQIWEKKWLSEERSNMSPTEKAIDILKYSSMPGTSRHHWGTDIDLNSVENSYFETKKGIRLYKWLNKNAHKYGFFQPYTVGRIKGYAEEPWHWSYFPLSSKYIEQYIDKVYVRDIEGFLGSEIADDIDVINGWVKLD